MLRVVVRASLFVMAIGAVLLEAACSRQPSLEPIATIGQIMETTIEPASDAIFDAAVWVNGEQVGGPKTPEDWMLLQAHAMMLAESTNLLLLNGRAKNRDAWATRTLALKEAAIEAAKAAEARNTEAIFDAGTHIFEACTACHLQYAPELTFKSPSE
jgi:hypothetical protein